MIKNLLSKRIIKSSLLGIIMAVVFAVSFALASIPLGSNFQLNSQLPLDARTVVVDIAARDAIPSGQRYRGLTVYVLSDATNYQLQAGITNGDWIALADAGGSMIYPGAGIAVSNGSSWGASIANNSTNWNTAYGWGNHASAGYLTSLTGAVLTSQVTPQTIGDTTNRLSKLWATDITVTNAIAGSVTGNAGTVTNGVYTNVANSFSLINPLTTISESWIGPSSTNGIYFKGGYVGIGNTDPSQKLDVTGNINISTNGTSILFSTYRGANAEGSNIWIGGGGQNSVGDVGNNLLGSRNTVLGYQALLADTTGSYNTALGYRALYSNTEGWENTALGYRTLEANVLGVANTAVGYKALMSAVNTQANTAVGYNALYSNVAGFDNTALGYYALYGNTGGNNTAIGVSALTENTTGAHNVAVGRAAGYNSFVPLLTNSFSTFLGQGANSSVDGVINSTAIGSLAQVTKSNQVVIGDTSVTETLLRGNVGINKIAPAQALDVVGSIALPMTVDSTSGVIYKEANPFIHNFALPGTTGFNTFVGINAGNFTMTGSTGDQGSYNTAIGFWALTSNTTGSRNIAIGGSVLRLNTTGSSNVANGMAALRNNTTGNSNTAVGDSTLYFNTSGSGNVANGYLALNENTIGNGNVAIGSNTMRANITGSDNVAIGGAALTYNTIGNNNTANGMGALTYNLIGNNNTAVGMRSLIDLGVPQLATTLNNGTSYIITSVGTTDFTAIGAGSNTVGEVFTATGPGTGDGMASFNINTDNNTAIGYNTGRGIITGINNTILGANVTGLPSNLSNTVIIADGLGNKFAHNFALPGTDGFNTFVGVGSGNFTMTGSTGGEGSRNTAMGYESLRANTKGNLNTAMGYRALYSNTEGYENTAIGYRALESNIDMSANTAVGYKALLLLSTAQANTAIGHNALASNISGNDNTAVGYYALLGTTTGGGNIAIGTNTLLENTTGGGNVAIGNSAGYNLAVPLLNNTSNVFIGNNSNSSVDGVDNSMALGYSAQVTKSDQVVIGNTSVTETLLRGNVGIGTTAPGELLSLGTAGTTKGVLSLAGVTSGKIIIQPADAAGSYTLTLPTTVGGAGQVLTDIAGDGVLGWTNGGGGGFTDPMTTAGDIIIRDATNVTTRLGVGGAGQVLTSDGTNISWEDPAGVSGAQTPWLSDINAAGYTLFGNNTASGNLTLDSTSDGVKGNVLINPTGGMVGIGTVNPLTNIEVYGTDAGIIVHHDGNSRGGIWALSDQRLAFAQTAASDDLVFGYGDAPVTSANFVERMRVVSSTGNVGIGTTVPEGRLHIFREQVANGADFYGPELILTRFWDGNTNTRAASIYNYYNNTTSNDQLVLGVTGDGGATTNPSLYDNAKMVIQANGYVGIGTTIPAQILDVAGNININANSAYMYDGTNVITALPSSDNYFFGNSGNFTMTGGSNLSSGGGAFSNNTTGEWNVAYGAGSLLNNTTGNNNIGIGLESLNVNTTGTSNIAIGVYTLKDLDITDGSGNNTAIGVNTGRGIVTGINNTIIGANVTGLDSALSNNIIIADGDGNQRINVNSSGNVGIGTTDPQKRLEINDDDANTTTSGLRFTDFACTGDDKLTVGAGGDVICATDQTDGGGTGNVVDTLTATLGAGNDANALDITNIGRLYTALGIEGSPAFSFQADTDTGMWSSLANILNFSTDATERMRIDDLGNVGIGTTAPEEMLNVMKNGGVGTRAGIYLQGIGSSYASVKLGSLATFSEFLVSAGNAGNTFGGFEIRDTNENATRLAIANTSGNVGIGTNTPGVQLEVFGASNKLGLTYSNNEYGPVGAELNSDINGDLHINALESGTVVAPRNIFLADNGGKVGIGTTNPTNILSVGDDLFTLDPKTISVGNTTGNSSVMIGQDGGTNFGYLRWNYNVVPANSTFDIQTGNNQPILINGYGGNVGIGMSNPSVALDVTGDIEYTGTITDVSDERLKENISDFNGALSIISSLQAKRYNMIGEEREEVGFIAQDVKSLFPRATSIIDPEKGYLGVSYVSLVPIVAQAVRELNLNLEGIAGMITPLEDSENETFVTTFFDNIKTTISTWLADATNGIGNMFADVFNAKEKICIDGECLTKDDVRALLLLVHPDGSPSIEEEEEPIEENPLPEEEPAIDEIPVDEAPDEEVPSDDSTPTEEVETDPVPVDEAPSEDPATIEEDPAPEETPTP